MIIENPEVTLDEDAHWFPDKTSKNGGIEWSITVNAHGDDGRQYWIDTGLLGYQNLNILLPSAGISQGADMCFMAVRSEPGKLVDQPGSVYKLADFPPVDESAMTFQSHPEGSITLDRSDDRVEVALGHNRFICKDDKTWHYSIADKEKGIAADFVHTGVGFPLWYYDKKELRAPTPHSLGGGYFWPGIVEGTLTVDGRTVRIKGKGARQRYYAADYCSEEVGGWHDWTWFHFDELFGCLEEMKRTKYKVMSLYLLDGERYLPDGRFNVEHHDWAYLHQIGCFIPGRYLITMETEAGTLEITADVVGSYCWAVTDVPDAPFAILDWDNLQGSFTYKDGRKKALTNGRGGTVIRQWRPYPNIFMTGLAGPRTLQETSATDGELVNR